jgi:hypothetical protein
LGRKLPAARFENALQAEHHFNDGKLHDTGRSIVSAPLAAMADAQSLWRATLIGRSWPNADTCGEQADWVAIEQRLAVRCAASGERLKPDDGCAKSRALGRRERCSHIKSARGRGLVNENL